MQPLISQPQSAVADTLPAGVASPDGERYFVTSPSGIDALDPATGAPVWSTSAANLPLLALSDSLLAIRGNPDPALSPWLGMGTLVSIPLAQPNAARQGPQLSLPLDRHRLCDVRIDGSRLLAGWHASAAQRAALAPRPADARGSLAIELVSGEVAISDESHIPAPMRHQLAGSTLW